MHIKANDIVPRTFILPTEVRDVFTVWHLPKIYHNEDSPLMYSTFDNPEHIGTISSVVWPIRGYVARTLDGKTIANVATLMEALNAF